MKYMDNLAKYNELIGKRDKLTLEITVLELQKEGRQSSVEHLLNDEPSNIDANSVKAIYEDAKSYIPKLHKRFDEVLDFHNAMAKNKAEFIGKNLPELSKQIEALKNELVAVLEEAETIKDYLWLEGRRVS